MFFVSYPPSTDNIFISQSLHPVNYVQLLHLPLTAAATAAGLDSDADSWCGTLHARCTDADSSNVVLYHAVLRGVLRHAPEDRWRVGYFQLCYFSIATSVVLGNTDILYPFLACLDSPLQLCGSV